ncbi:MAG: hypothetical protein QW227_01665 [Candidatus Aenigmatarchaeota archaeon]
MYKPFESRLPLWIAELSETRKISLEEATLEILRIRLDPERVQDLIKAYEKEKMCPAKYGGKILRTKTYPPKSKKNHALFLRFYRAAKRDLKSKGRISEKTLAMIK